MSESVYDAVIGVLGPLVGKPVAEISIRSAAIKVGKTSEMLTESDLDSVLAEIQASMSGFTSADVLVKAQADIRTRVGG